jgi:hypothetical protein
MVAKVLLGRQGYQASLRIGVGRSETGAFEAHAWVERNGTVMIGGPKSLLKRYTSLPALDE